jgi:uncharacterized protein YndB with AHSA1/START domain
MTITNSIDVRCPRDVAFRVFCDEIADWWPTGQNHSFGGERTKSTRLEARVGGRLYEKMIEGDEIEIGRVTAYEPPARVVFTWRAPSWEQSTVVEVRFTPQPDGTRVELTHSGWEQAAVLIETSKLYVKGWDFVLGKYAARVGSA